MQTLLLLFVANVLVNNVVLARFLGLCPFMGVSRDIESALGMGLATTFVLTMSSIATWLLEYGVLEPLGLGYLRLLTMIMVIAAMVQLTELYIAKQSPALHQVLGIFLPLITTNCAVLGVALLIIQQQLSFTQSLVYGFASALGFTLVIVIFAGLRMRLALSHVPKIFAGTPIAFITAGTLAMAFSGFAGMAH
ncbi:electron transport complex subunit RsxA [Celerinatantimonas yamalensis]|uniref:Ion-translocating oxidoreductase complex subunit A n=1 Tax=Celerinatantimonas yamalensis TaxID=559956 RepID=A0ABW9G3P4_9GAMM